jgi:hypothetical protein
MKQNKNLLKSFIAFGLLAVIAIAMIFAYSQYKQNSVKGAKEIVIEISTPDEGSKEFTFNTDAEFLGQLLEEEDLAKGTVSEYGLFITEVNGRVADDTKQEWWCITKDGADVFTGVEVTPIADGEHYEMTLKVGY